MECHWKRVLIENGMSLKWNVTPNGMSLQMECHPKWNVTQNVMSIKMECYSKWNVTQSGWQKVEI